MKIKKMVRRAGRWAEEYVDLGPGRAREGHGSPMRRVHDQRVGPGKLGPKAAQA